MSRVLFVSTVAPFPVDNGKKVVVSGVLRYLVGRYGAEQVSYVLLGSMENERLAPEAMPCRYVVVEKPGTLRRIWNVLLFALVKRTKSVQESMFLSKKLGERLRGIVAENEPGLVVCDTFRTGQFFETDERTESRYVLYMDDLFSVRYRKMLSVKARFPDARLNLLGNFARFVPEPLRPLLRFNKIQNWLLRLERKLAERREQECPRWFDSNLLINAAEADLLRSKTGASSIETVKPLLYDVGGKVERRYGGEPTFVFLGALNVPHNQFSITHFLETQMDDIAKQIPNLKLRIIGRDAKEDLLRLAARYADCVSVEGFVEDLDEVFGTSCAMVVPLLFGSGVKIKTLDALSRGLPVIATDFGVEGIPVEPGVDCVVENDLDRYPELMLRLTEAGENQRLSRNAREFFVRNYSEEHVLREYDRLFKPSSEY